MGQDQADATAKQPGSARVVVPDLRGLTATEAMRIGMAGFVMVVCPNPNFGSARNLQGTVVRQRPEAGAAVERYAETAVWSSGRGDDAGVRGPRTACNPGMVSGTALSGGELDAPLAGGDPARLLGELPAVAFMVPRRCTGARMHCPERERADGPVLSRLVMADQSRTRRSPPRPMAIGLRHGQNCVSELPKVSGR